VKYAFLLLALPLLCGGAGNVFNTRPVRECAACHPAQAKPAVETSMGHAMELVSECGVLKSHALMTFSANGYAYRIERKGEQSFYSVSDGKNTLTAPIGWAFGLGAAGQTYVIEKDGAYYESFVSYYKELDGLDLTMGDQNTHPTSLIEAMGRAMGEREKLACFNCHATNSVTAAKLTLNTMSAGVQCERCHGDSANHLAALKKGGDVSLFAMKKLGAFTSEETSNFCGQCHRTWEQIAGSGPRGVLNVRFQPYRLTNSRCYDVDDKRIACTGCHDPHKEIDRVATHYDAKCLSCHGGAQGARMLAATQKGNSREALGGKRDTEPVLRGSSSGKPGAQVCKVAKQDCSTCHMPKVELPGAHHLFSDHDIRIVRPKAGYPD
jgi:hypothetical protein